MPKPTEKRPLAYYRRRAVSALAKHRALLAVLVALACLPLLFTEWRPVFFHVLVFGVLVAACAAVVYLPALVRRWRETLLVAGVCSILFVLVQYVVGPVLLRTVVVPLYDLDVDHRHAPEPGRFNEDGVQPDVPASDYDPADFNIVFLGDSFTAGEWLADPTIESFPFQAEKRLRERLPDARIRVVNFGWVSSSPVLQLRQLKQIGARYHPDLVVQNFDMTDFSDDIKYSDQLGDDWSKTPGKLTILRAMDVRFSMLLRETGLAKWLSDHFRFREVRNNAPETGRYFALHVPLQDSRPYLKTTRKAIEMTAQAARDLGAGFALYIHPRYPHYNKSECPFDFEKWEIQIDSPYLFAPFTYFAELQTEEDFPIVSLLPTFQNAGPEPTVFRHDPHYNSNGHHIAGTAIADSLIDLGLVPSPDSPADP